MEKITVSLNDLLRNKVLSHFPDKGTKKTLEIAIFNGVLELEEGVLTVSEITEYKIGCIHSLIGGAAIAHMCLGTMTPDQVRDLKRDTDEFFECEEFKQLCQLMQ